MSTALTPAAPAVPDEQPNNPALLAIANPALTAKAKCAVRTNAEQSLDTAAATRIAALEAACVRVQEEFQNLFAG